MDAGEFIRVVTLRKGRLRPSEFMIRPGEKGISLFAYGVTPSPAEVIEAVRAAGKQGDLAAALISNDQLRALGLRVVQTTGGTSVPDVDALHYEARLSLMRTLFLRLRGFALHDYFNSNISRNLCTLARLLG